MSNDPLNELRPGTAMTDEQKAKLAEANAASSAEAQTMAANRRAQDEREKPLVQTLADSVKDKLKQLPPLEENPQQ